MSLPYSHLTTERLRHHIANMRSDRRNWEPDDAETYRQLCAALAARTTKKTA